LLSTPFDCDDVQEIINKGYENALLPVTKAIDKIMLGGIQDLLVTQEYWLVIKSKLLTDTSNPCEVQKDN
jgi:hypothetical protein